MVKLNATFSILLCFAVVIVNAQGIRFENASSWKDVLAKAKAENKYIFVDCYATWCGPCKAMEQQVYPLKEVGDVYNNQFISIKLQFDKTDKDDSLTRKWYQQAANFQSTYAVNAYPTYLFFDANGKPVHKVVGGQTEVSFIQIAQDARIPEKQYYSIIKNYVPGRFDTGELKGLAGLFLYDNKELAGKILKDYFGRTPKKEWAKDANLTFLVRMNITRQAGEIASYILSRQKLSSKQRLSLFNAFQNESAIQDLAYNQLRPLSKKQLSKEEDLQLLNIFRKQQKFKPIADKYINSLTIKGALTKDNINLMSSFLNSSTDKSFSFFLNHSNEIDMVTHTPHYSENVVCKIITKEILEPEIKKAKSLNREPEWNSLSNAIEIKYGKSYADRSIVTEKPKYYEEVKQWKEFAKALVSYVDSYAPIKPEKAFYLNNMAYAVFENTDDENNLIRANEWMDVALRSDTTVNFYGAYVDTKASILYKLGSKKDAIDLEERAIAIDRRRNPGIKSFEETLEKMKRGEKIWPEKVEGK